MLCTVIHWRILIVTIISLVENINIVFVCLRVRFLSSDPTKMGGLSMLLLAGERALSAREVGTVCLHSHT